MKLGSLHKMHYVSLLNLLIIRRLLFGLLLLVGVPSLLFAQGTEQFEDAGTIYQIDLGGFEGNVDLNNFVAISYLGELSTESLKKRTKSSDGLTHVYLGKYLGRATVEAVLQQLRALGYNNTTLDIDNTSLNTGQGLSVVSAVRLEKSRGLDFSKFIKWTSKMDFFILYRDGFFLVLTNLHDPITRDQNFRKTMDEFIFDGFDAFPVPFR